MGGTLGRSVLAIALGLLAGCGGGDADDEFFDADVGEETAGDGVDGAPDGGDVTDGDGGDGETGPVCGDGTVDDLEDCDDGNDVAGDGCESDCTFTCTAADDACPADRHCEDATHTCEPGCRADEGCTDPVTGLYCDVEAHACVVCLEDDHCEAGTVCIDHACVEGCSETHACPAGLDCCGGGCVDLQGSEEHCGACGAPCTVVAGVPECVAGACTIGSCDAGFADCDGEVATGCEIETALDVENCGACGTVCPERDHAATTCDAGVCGYACATGYLDCNALADDGCEVDGATDPDSCGGCGAACPAPAHAAAACVDGTCGMGACDAGWSDCNADAADGCEIETAADPLHCGACDAACSTSHLTPTCILGDCGGACDAGWADCDGSRRLNGCETDVGTDPENCGGCGAECSTSDVTPACSGGSCTGTCDAGYGDCNADLRSDGCETDTTASVDHCGGCGAACPSRPHATAACTDGTCGWTCDPDWSDCDGDASNGCETDTTASVDHCGACGAACSTSHLTPLCVGGVCSGTCAAGWSDCNADLRSDGCETALTTLTDCGACGVACSRAHATATCGTGSCRIASCDTSYADCNGTDSDGCETNLLEAIANCGSCGNVCTNAHGSTSCSSGICSPVCSGLWGDCDGDPDDGCDVALTTTSNCGACGTVCSLANAGESCTTGTCLITSCEDGWCNEDGVHANGCEHDLDTDPSCSSYIGLGTVSGDLGSSSVSWTGHDERWFRVAVSENDLGSSCEDLCIRVNLDVPSGTDYDLYGYCDNCTGSDASSTMGGSTDETMYMRWEEDCIWPGIPSGSESGRNIYIRVLLYSANVCSDYTLTVTGNSCSGGNTCSTK